MLQHNYYKLLNPTITILLTVKVKKNNNNKQYEIITKTNNKARYKN